MLLCGDVMTGRGVDQILPHPGDPQLRESYIREATGYVALAEAASGPIPRPVGPAWPWGDALEVLGDLAPDVRLINLETSITRSGDFAPGKQVHYRMDPANIGCLTVALPDVCALANNHVLDFGQSGLAETLDTLAGAGLPAAGRRRPGGPRPGARRLLRDGLVRHPARVGGRPVAGRRRPASQPLPGRRRPVDRPGPGGRGTRRSPGGLAALGIELGV